MGQMDFFMCFYIMEIENSKCWIEILNLVRGVGFEPTKSFDTGS